MHRMLPVPPEVKARERERRSASGGRWRRFFSPDSAEVLAGRGLVVFLGAIIVSRALAELFDRIGWGLAADVTAGVVGSLATFGFLALGVHIVVKVRRREMHW